MGEATSKATLYCSFCGKSQHEVRKLIAGPASFICDECVELCMGIIREQPHTRRPIDLNQNIPEYIWRELAEERAPSVEMFLTQGGFLQPEETVDVCALLRAVLTSASERINYAAPVRARMEELEQFIEERRAASNQAFEQETEKEREELRALRLRTPVEGAEVQHLPVPKPRTDSGPTLAVKAHMESRTDEGQ